SRFLSLAVVVHIRLSFFALLLPSYHPFFFKWYAVHLDLHSFPTTTLFRSMSSRLRLTSPMTTAPGTVSVARAPVRLASGIGTGGDRKSTRLNSSHGSSSYAVFCLKKKRRGQTR